MHGRAAIQDSLPSAVFVGNDPMAPVPWKHREHGPRVPDDCTVGYDNIDQRAITANDHMQPKFDGQLAATTLLPVSRKVNQRSVILSSTQSY